MSTKTPVILRHCRGIQTNRITDEIKGNNENNDIVEPNEINEANVFCMVDKEYDLPIIKSGRV